MSDGAHMDWPIGIHLDVPEDVYHRRELGVVSNSALKLVSRSLAHYRAWVAGAEKDPTDALRLGKALHMRIFEPERFERTYVVEPEFGDCRTPANKKARDAWRAAHAGAHVLVESEKARLINMIESVLCHPAAMRLVAEGHPEVTGYWIDPATGLRCKLRADWWVKPKRIGVDLKSTKDASLDEFGKDCARYGYYRQLALYSMGFKECAEQLDHFALIAVEKEPPYAVAVRVLDEDAMRQGYLEVRRDMETLARGMREERFPAYSDGVETQPLPRWKLTG